MAQKALEKKGLIGHLACFAAYAIFGINILFCKDIANEGGIPPIALFTFRAFGAGMLFWIISIFLPHEHVDRKDYLKIIAASLLGLLAPQMTFLTAITMTAPIDLSVINTITPIMTMFIAAIALKEPITWKKAGGVLLSFIGIVLLILQSIGNGEGAPGTKPMGVVLVVLNSLSFALYLGIFRPLIAKYHVVTFMKWMFLVAFIVSFPLSIGHIVNDIDYTSISGRVVWEIGFLILFATFFAYFLIPIGQKRIRPTLVSMYGYLQPMIATIGGIAAGMDRLTIGKIVAACMVIGGVLVVNKSRSAADTIKDKRT